MGLSSLSQALPQSIQKKLCNLGDLMVQKIRRPLLFVEARPCKIIKKYYSTNGLFGFKVQ
jgi:hypothetical protein